MLRKKSKEEHGEKECRQKKSKEQLDGWEKKCRQKKSKEQSWPEQSRPNLQTSSRDEKLG